MIMDAKTIAIGMRGPANVGTHAGPASKPMARRATLNAGTSSHGCTRMNTDVFLIKTVSVFIRVHPWLKNAFCPVSMPFPCLPCPSVAKTHFDLFLRLSWLLFHVAAMKSPDSAWRTFV